VQEAQRFLVWAAILAGAIVCGVAGGIALHTWEHPHQPRVVVPSIIMSAAIRYYAAHGSYPQNGIVRAHDGSPSPWDEVLLANDRCSGGGAFVFEEAPGRLAVTCETDDRIFVEIRPWWR
jgi:hypothetical protein